MLTPTVRWLHPNFAFVFSRRFRQCSCVLALFFLAGCESRRPPRFRVADAAFARPIVPAASLDASLAAAPDIDLPPLHPQLIVTHSAPAKPRVVSPPATESPRSGKPQVPILAPELTTEELSIARGETQRSLGVADGNIALAQARRLTSAQTDLLSQIRGFAESARDAIHEGDWSRARNLAKKAEVLSQELAGTL